MQMTTTVTKKKKEAAPLGPNVAVIGRCSHSEQLVRFSLVSQTVLGSSVGFLRSVFVNTRGGGTAGRCPGLAVGRLGEAVPCAPGRAMRVGEGGRERGAL